ncbi:Serine/threonine-protein kinase, active site [Sesbania bispinosa]|nr:Serine/threonine-protein kinase, active site [Sesbania bispinosa]
MQNGNLQDALLRRKCPEFFDWNKRFAIPLDIAKGIHYLHSCDPPIIHGDIKPSNILLDRDFSVKIGDFGLASLKLEPPQVELDILKGNLGMEQSSASPKTMAITASPEMGLAIAASPRFDKASVQSEKDVDVVGGFKRNGKGLKSNSVRDWWWKHNNEVVASGSSSTPVGEAKKVKDYVMEWLGREVNKEGTNKSELVGGKPEKKSKKQELEWWESMDEENVGEVLTKQPHHTKGSNSLSPPEVSG